jgi:type IV secretory pathway TrbL component
VKPSRPLLQCLSEGKLVWTTSGATKEDTAAVAALLKSKEACSDLTSVVLISNESSATAAAGAALGRKCNSISATSRATTAVRPVKKPQRGAQPAHLKDATGEVRTQ